MRTEVITTSRGISSRVHTGGSGSPVLYLHGTAGLDSSMEFVEALATRHSVVAPELPGFGELSGEELLDDMLDFTLHGWDLVTTLGLERPAIVGHSMGGMIAAEMTSVSPERTDRLVLVSALGLWSEEFPVPDIFAMLPFEYAEIFFDDSGLAESFLVGSLDVDDPAALRPFVLANGRRLGTAGKIMFPIPDRKVAKRLYRATPPTLVAWGDRDRFLPTEYQDLWVALLPNATAVRIADAGHMVPSEQPEALAGHVFSFLST